MNPLEVIEQKETFISGNTINIKSLSKVYDIKKVEMSRLLDCKRQQVNNIFSKTNYSPRSEINRKKLLDMVKIYTILRILLKPPESEKDNEKIDEKISHWFRIPNPAYPDAASPFELVSSGRGNIVIRSLMDELHNSAA
jgi:hypothetical protein